MALLTTPLPFQKHSNFALSVIAIAATVALLYYGRSFFITLFISAAFAFILDPAVVLVMRLHLPRAAATGIVIAIALLGVYLVGVVTWAETSILAEDLPTYTSRLNELLDKTSDKLEQVEKKTVDTFVPKSLRQQEQQIQQKPQEAMKARRRRAGLTPDLTPVSPSVQNVRIVSEQRPVLTTFYGYASRYFHSLLMVSFIPFLTYFMLSWRDHFSRGILRLFPGEDRYAVAKSWAGVADSTRAFVLGNFWLWIFLSIASAIAFFFLGVPYWPLVGLISGFFSLIPYVGLPLSILPPILSTLAVPNKFTTVLAVTLTTAGLHLFALNFLYAKVVGKRVRLNPLVVTISLMFWAAMWGGVGLILAIPITAALKVVCDNIESLQPMGRLLGE